MYLWRILQEGAPGYPHLQLSISRVGSTINNYMSPILEAHFATAASADSGCAQIRHDTSTARHAHGIRGTARSHLSAAVHQELDQLDA